MKQKNLRWTVDRSRRLLFLDIPRTQSLMKSSLYFEKYFVNLRYCTHKMTERKWLHLPWWVSKKSESLTETQWLWRGHFLTSRHQEQTERVDGCSWKSFCKTACTRNDSRTSHHSSSWWFCLSTWTYTDHKLYDQVIIQFLIPVRPSSTSIAFFWRLVS